MLLSCMYSNVEFCSYDGKHDEQMLEEGLPHHSDTLSVILQDVKTVRSVWPSSVEDVEVMVGIYGN